jgi:outer membrane protein TolC
MAKAGPGTTAENATRVATRARGRMAGPRSWLPRAFDNRGLCWFALRISVLISISCFALMAIVPPASADDEVLQQYLQTNLTPIDLSSAFRLAGVQNSEILLAQQRVTEAVALRQLAAAQFLPTLNAGSNIDSHRGVLQDSNGTILSVNRDALYVGAGALAVGGSTVRIPGVVLTGNVSEAVYGYLISRQEVARRDFASQAVSQDTLLAVALAYVELVRAEGQYRVAVLTRDDAREVARLTAAYLKTGQGRKADADRAATELARREANVIQAEGDIGTTSARLCALLHLDPSLRLHPVEDQILPKSIVPDPIPLPDLLAIALLNRPELKERRTAVVQALLALNQAHWLPFSPTVYIGYSVGDFGGGSNLVAQPVGSGPDALGDPRFGLFSPRQDLDVMAYWTLLNLGVGNRALIDAARSRLRSADLREVAVLDQVRSEVASAYAKTHARYAQIRTCELAIQSSTEAFHEDMNRILGQIGLPLEVVDSLRLLSRSRVAYLDAILDYNRAQFELYVAVGKPPADVLIRPAGDNGEDPAVARLVKERTVPGPAH